ncbi:MAG TPA: M14 family zinc carboxypeptidase [Candidatus Cloacimonadota bacterium]|nr:M14 family zinc carboxypeptidase [Candidatus Cloacimonadota bacterium]
MRLILTFIIALIIATPLIAFPVRISSWEADRDVKTLNAMHISIDSVNRSTGTIMAFVRHETEFQSLLAAGFDAIRLPNPAPELARKLNDPLRDGTPPQNEYYSITQYLDFMVQTAAQYPNICILVTAGNSIQNRPLYFMKISDNASQDEAEPEFRYISSIHGDEVVGYDMCIRLIQQLTTNYGTDTRVTQMVDNTEIWICPMMNPDGFVLGQRYNAAGIDLNRNFPMPTGEQHPDGNATGQENTAIMNFSNSRGFQLSANFHGGAEVINYPWDYTYTLAPDDALIQAAALTYSSHNSLLYNSTEFPQGITNGAQWYVITGSLQDWSYGYTDCIDLTAEIGNNKWPPASQLPTFWGYNQESMLALIEFAQKGARGTVTSVAGLPLLDATITVAGNAKVTGTNPGLADWYRLLLPGSYSITAAAPGYIPQTVQLSVPTTGFVTHNFVLQLAANTYFSGQIRNADGSGISNLVVALNTVPERVVNADANGTFSFGSVPEGQYIISFRQAGQTFYSKSFLLTAENNRLVFIYSPPTTVFTDVFDNSNNWTATSPWGVTPYTGNNVLTDSPGGNYANNINKSCRLTNPLNLSQIASPTLSYRTRYSLENGYDFVYVEASTNGTDWQQLTSYTGSQTSWTDVSLSLAPYSGQNMHLRFRIQTDTSVNLDGIFIDDLVVEGISMDNRYFGDPDGDQIISSADMLIVLDYSVGLDPIPQIDPIPWNQTLLFACDVDQNDAVNAVDAYLIYKYITDPSYRFQAQNSLNYDFSGVTMDVDATPGFYQFSFSPSADLEVLETRLSSPDSISGWEVQFFPTGTGRCYALNAQTKHFAWIKAQADLQYMNQSFQTPLGQIICDYALNGTAGQVTLLTGSPNDDTELPAPIFSLHQNYPNPFNPNTTISFSVTDPASPSSLRIYNLKGQLTKTLCHSRLETGIHKLNWDGKDDQGRSVSSGVYLYRLENGSHTQTRKMILAQ